jgi:hypothetical protein
MLRHPRPAGLASKPRFGADWVHEIKHDGYRIIVRPGTAPLCGSTAATRMTGLCDCWPLPGGRRTLWITTKSFRSHDHPLLTLLTTTYKKGGIYCSSCALKTAFTESLISALLGWWGFPWGLFHTPAAILSNARGGEWSHDVADRLTCYNACFSPRVISRCRMRLR